jgi:hypothetical protein
MTHVTEGVWRVKLKGRRAVTSAVLDGVWLDYRTAYRIALDDSRNALAVKGVAE